MHVNHSSLALVLLVVPGKKITFVMNFKINRRAMVLLYRQWVHFLVLCFEIIKNNHYEALHQTTLNIDKPVKIDTTQRLTSCFELLLLPVHVEW